jgi:dynein heavy chain
MNKNKLVTLIYGNKIRVEKCCKILFEAYDLLNDLLVSIILCGMVNVNSKNLSY